MKETHFFRSKSKKKKVKLQYAQIMISLKTQLDEFILKQNKQLESQLKKETKFLRKDFFKIENGLTKLNEFNQLVSQQVMKMSVNSYEIAER